MENKKLTKKSRIAIVRIERIGIALMILFILLTFFFFLNRQSLFPLTKQPTKIPTLDILSEGVMVYDDLIPIEKSLYRVWDANFSDLKGNPVKLSDFREKVLIMVVQSEESTENESLLQLILNFLNSLSDNPEVVVRILKMPKEDTGDLDDSIIQSFVIYDNQNFIQQIGLKRTPAILFFNPAGMLMTGIDPYMVTIEKIQNYSDYAANGGLMQTEKFVLTALLENDGSIVSDYSILPSGEVQKGNTILSESLGILLEFAAKKGNQQLFDQVLHFINENMTVSGLVSWKSTDGAKATVNATLDDLRIIAALGTADDRWGGYSDEFALRAASLMNYAVKKGKLTDFYDWELKKSASELKLCYIDINALNILSEFDPSWQDVKKNSLQILEKGLISQTTPLYHSGWSFDSKKYTNTYLHMSEEMLAILQSARAGFISERTIAFLKTKLREGVIYGLYDTGGSPLQGYGFESTATYAILIQIGLAVRDDDLIRLALAHMEHFRVMDGNEKIIGSYSGDLSGLQYTFDQLSALAAWQELTESHWLEKMK
ncbi:MAG: glycosyl hydrolase family 8 [Flexilinea sp.]